MFKQTILFFVISTGLLFIATTYQLELQSKLKMDSHPVWVRNISVSAVVAAVLTVLYLLDSPSKEKFHFEVSKDKRKCHSGWIGKQFPFTEYTPDGERCNANGPCKKQIDDTTQAFAPYNNQKGTCSTDGCC